MIEPKIVFVFNLVMQIKLKLGGNKFWSSKFLIITCVLTYWSSHVSCIKIIVSHIIFLEKVMRKKLNLNFYLGKKNQIVIFKTILQSTLVKPNWNVLTSNFLLIIYSLWTKIY